jgi:hypothetical protein
MAKSTYILHSCRKTLSEGTFVNASQTSGMRPIATTIRDAMT